MKKKISLTLTTLILLTSVNFTACDGSLGGQTGFREGVLRVASWDEYICMGGEDAYNAEEYPDQRPLYEEFEDWYKQVYGKDITVEYVALQDNETMYNKIKMGDSYDLLCPSEYMMMKLAAEGRLERLPESFYDTSNEYNYYAKNLSPYIRDIFTDGKMKDGGTWSQYGAGYMLGTTGFVFNPENVDGDVMRSWSAFSKEECARKVTAKDNVRDSYFIGLGMYYEQEIADGRMTKADFDANKKAYMNDTSPQTMAKVKSLLIEMRENLYGLETDEGKQELIAGRLDASFQWSGDGVYTLDQAEENDIYLEYRIPDLVSNLWFDAWVMMKGANVEAATAFINFLSRPDNVARNMYYIGYTSCIAGDEVFDYVADTYDDPEGDTQYDLSYFFGEGHTLTTTQEQTRQQLFAQYPDRETIKRLVVMDYFDNKTNERANRMWINIK